MAGIAQKTQSAAAGLRQLGLALALLPAPACAGAWIAPERQSIWTEVAGARDEVFFSESALYLETPIAQRASVVFSPWVTQDPAQGGTLDALRWEAALGAKQEVLRGERYVMAVQAGAIWYSDPEPRCSEAGLEARWLGGASFAEGRGFANLEAARRASEGGCDATRVDLTLGYRPGENWLGMAQIFADRRTGEPAVRMQLSVVRFGRGGRGLQLGVRARLDEGAGEPAIVLGFWGRPRD